MPVYNKNGEIICGEIVPTFTDADCTTAFLAYMAAKCTEWGMDGTHYENPSGLTTASYSTPRDELKLGFAVTANNKALDIWSVPDATFSIRGDHARTISVANNVFSLYSALDSSGYNFLGGKGGSLTMSGYDRAAVLLVEIESHPVILALMARGQTAYQNIANSAKELCDMVKASINGQTPSAGTNLTALVSGGGGYAACLVPGASGGYLHFATPAELLTRAHSISGNPTANRVPASTTKTMTMLCALDYFYDTHETVTVKTVDIVGGSGSTFYDGDELTFWDAVRIMMMESSNTLANTIARETGYKILCAQA